MKNKISEYFEMPNSKAKKQRLQSLEKARSKNSKHFNRSTIDVMTESQLETSDDSIADVTPDNLTEHNEQIDTDTDITPEDLQSSSEDRDPDFTASPSKLMIIPDTFLAHLLQLVACPICLVQGKIVANVTNANGFANEINFLCRCKTNFSINTFPETNINEVLTRNIIANGITKQAFQRFLQIGNFGAIVDGKEKGINLFTRQSTAIFRQQNQAIIDGAKRIHKAEIDHLYRANRPLVLSTDMCYTKRGYHSPAGHAAIISNKTVIDAMTIKRSSNPSETAYGEITDKPANKIEEFAITKMLKHLVPVLGPLITQIDLDQDAVLHNVIKNLKWEKEDIEEVNKWTGRYEISNDMIGKSIWSGKVPKICFDKVSKILNSNRFESEIIATYCNILYVVAIDCNILQYFRIRIDSN